MSKLVYLVHCDLHIVFVNHGSALLLFCLYELMLVMDNNNRQYELYELILRMNKEQGISYRKISAFFNASGVTTALARGGAKQVHTLTL